MIDSTARPQQEISALEKFRDEQREGVGLPALRRRNNKSDNREGSNVRLAGSNDLLAVRGGQLPQQKS